MASRSTPVSLTPVARFAPELLLKAQGIRAVIFDVDGVLTDGSLYIGERGEAFKAFNTLDGHGIKLLASAGILPTVITGRDSPAVRRRVAELGIPHAFYGVSDKLAVAEAAMQAVQLDWESMAVMGDDWPDLPLLTRAAFACVPPGAHVEVLAIADHVTRAGAGCGSARECCDILLTAAGRYAELLHGHLTTLDRVA
jgi:3-deoxy-D-manno-octulosonate 8-phosphate phosphatase (KDO 8-P phosphatase)